MSSGQGGGPPDGDQSGGPPDHAKSKRPDHVDDLVPFLQGRSAAMVRYESGSEIVDKRAVDWDLSLGGDRAEFEQDNGFRVTLDVARDVEEVWEDAN